MLFVFIQYNVSIYAILHNEYWFITWKIYQNSSASKLYLYMARELDSCFNRQQIMKTLVSSIVKIYILCLINMHYFGMWIVGKEPKAKGFLVSENSYWIPAISNYFLLGIYIYGHHGNFWNVKLSKQYSSSWIGEIENGKKR